jgi:hypothetical protein
MDDLFRHFFWIIFPVLGMGVGAFSIWNEFSRQKKALEVLKVYAEKGVEPPASVTAVLNRASTSERPQNHFAQTAFFGVMALGFAGLTIWLGFNGGASIFVAGFAICGFALAALAASSLVQGLTTRRSDAP